MEQATEFAAVLGTEQGFHLVHQTRLDQLGQALVQRLHLLLGAGLDDGVDLVRLVLADEVANGIGGIEHLKSGDAAPAVLSLDQCLRNHAQQVHR